MTPGVQSVRRLKFATVGDPDPIIFPLGTRFDYSATAKCRFYIFSFEKAFQYKKYYPVTAWYSGEIK